MAYLSSRSLMDGSENNFTVINNQWHIHVLLEALGYKQTQVQ